MGSCGVSNRDHAAQGKTAASQFYPFNGFVGFIDLHDRGAKGGKVVRNIYILTVNLGLFIAP